jgi:copper chaperone CopZ
MSTLNFIVTGMHCDACQKVIALKVKKLPSVTDVSVSPNGQATVTSSAPLSITDIQKALEGTEYQVTSE